MVMKAHHTLTTLCVIKCEANEEHCDSPEMRSVFLFNMIFGDSVRKFFVETVIPSNLGETNVPTMLVRIASNINLALLVL